MSHPSAGKVGHPRVLSTVIRNMADLMAILKQCDDEGRISFIQADAAWCRPCRTIHPFFDALVQHWMNRVALATISFNIDEAEQVCSYFDITRIPYIVCLLPAPHSILTLKELRFEGTDPASLEFWFTNIMHKWTSSVYPLPVILDGAAGSRKVSLGT